MPTTTGPLSPTPGVTLTEEPPQTGSATPQVVAVVVVNTSPYRLEIAPATGKKTWLVDPFTRDIVPLDPTTTQQIEITADQVLPSPAPVNESVFLLWYQASEQLPSNLPMQLGITSTTTATEQIFLAKPSSSPYSITLNAQWRSVWVVTTSAVVPTLVGDQSGLGYASFTPPYLTGAGKFYRFPLIAGLDASVGLTFDATVPTWVGADLADIDAVAYTASGGVPGSVVFYSSLTGAGETATPGDLTQAGGFTVNDNGQGVFLNTSATAPGNGLQISDSSAVGVAIATSGGGGQIQLYSGAGAATVGIDLRAVSGTEILLEAASPGKVVINGGIGGTPPSATVSPNGVSLTAPASFGTPTINVSTSSGHVIEILPNSGGVSTADGLTLCTNLDALQFFRGGTSGGPNYQQSVTGALSAVTDANAKAVLTSLIDAIAAYGLVLKATT